MSRKGRAKQKKQQRLRNKRLVKKYGNWIRVRWWNRHKMRYDFADNYLNEYDAFGGGWGMLWRMLIADLNPLIHKYNLQDTFQFEEIKEKYGEIRVYHNCCIQEISDLIDSYAAISSNVCQWCGRPDSAVSKGGWVECQCKQCYEKYWSKRGYDKKYEEDFNTDPEKCKIAESYIYRRFSKEGSRDFEIDLTDITDRYRKKWNNKDKNKRKRCAMNGISD